MVRKINVNEQYQFQCDIIEKTGLNLVTCGNCGSTLIHKVSDEQVSCPYCFDESDPCDFPDKFYQENKPFAFQIRRDCEFLGDGVELSDDKSFENSWGVYLDTNRGFIYAVHENHGSQVRVFRLTETLDELARKYRYEILNTMLSKVTAEDEVTVYDVFMHGKHIVELIY